MWAGTPTGHQDFCQEDLHLGGHIQRPETVSCMRDEMSIRGLLTFSFINAPVQISDGVPIE
jgi:hypothetical protein